MFLAMHGLNRSAQTAGQVLGTRTNNMFKKQQANNQRKIMDTTILESVCRVHDIIFEKEVKAYHSSLMLSYLHMVLKKKSTTHKFLSLQNENLVIHLLDDFHIVNVHTHLMAKASSAIHTAPSLLGTSQQLQSQVQ